MKEVLFVCVRNSGRSQMAEAFFNRLAEERGLDVRAGSAGTQPAERVNATVRQVMIEVGLDMAALKPKLLTEEMVERAEVVVTMGCAVDANACPASGGRTSPIGACRTPKECPRARSGCSGMQFGAG